MPKLSFTGSKVDIPFAIEVMNFRCPDMTAHWAAVMFKPNIKGFSVFKPLMSQTYEVHVMWVGTEPVK